MSAHDPFASIAADFDRPVSPRPEFAARLAERLLSELREPVPARRPSSRLGAWLHASANPRVRLVLLAAVLLLVLAGVATATYLGVRVWISTSPRGVQVADDYRLATVYTNRGSEGPVAPWALSPDGHVLVGLRYVFRTGERAALVRLNLRTKATRIEPLRELADPRSAIAAEPTTIGATQDPWGPRPNTAAYAPDGDLFSLLDADDAESLVVRRPNGSRQQVLTLGQLVKAGLLPAGRHMSPAVAVSAVGRIWLRVDSDFASSHLPSVHTLFEVTDPNNDGDWSDRVVRRVVFPAGARGLWTEGRSIHGFGTSSFVGDPTNGGSVLDLVGGPGSRVRVYRLADRNDDGDVADPGEFRLVLDRTGPLAALTLMAVSPATRPRAREIVFAGLTHPDRVSVLSASGRLSDVGRSFSGSLRGLAVDGDGRIYVATFNNLDAPRSVTRVYRLAPAATELQRAAPEPTPHVTAPPPGTPVIAATIQSAGGSRVSYWLSANGGPRRALGTNLGSICQSADGSAVAFASDVAVPQEDFVYTTRAAGGGGRKVSERRGKLLCGWSGRWLVLASRISPLDWPASTLYRLDTHGGRDVVLARNVDRYSLSPDGLHLAYVQRTSTAGRTRETLQLVDVATLARRQLAGPMPGRTYGVPLTILEPADLGFAWTPDGGRLAYVSSRMPWHPASWYTNTGEPTAWNPFTIWTQEVSGGTAHKVGTTRSRPGLAWSADATRLLVCACARPGATTGGGPLTIIGGATGARRASFSNIGLDFAAWAPTGHALAYATPDALWLLEPGGRFRKIAEPPAFAGVREWPLGTWLGWSPDGRDIGLGTVSPLPNAPDLVAAVDVRTGRVRVRLRARTGTDAIEATWWRP